MIVPFANTTSLCTVSSIVNLPLVRPKRMASETRMPTRPDVQTLGGPTPFRLDYASLMFVGTSGKAGAVRSEEERSEIGEGN